jgi:hypothetical protein
MDLMAVTGQNYGSYLTLVLRQYPATKAITMGGSQGLFNHYLL